MCSGGSVGASGADESSNSTTASSASVGAGTGGGVSLVPPAALGLGLARAQQPTPVSPPLPLVPVAAAAVAPLDAVTASPASNGLSPQGTSVPTAAVPPLIVAAGVPTAPHSVSAAPTPALAPPHHYL
jgi:hypothetical protein